MYSPQRRWFVGKSASGNQNQNRKGGIWHWPTRALQRIGSFDSFVGQNQDATTPFFHDHVQQQSVRLKRTAKNV